MKQLIQYISDLLKNIFKLQDLCRQLYPDSIRAQYGKTIVHNAVHCTDLPEDGENEVEYFFKLLAND